MQAKCKISEDYITLPLMNETPYLQVTGLCCERNEQILFSHLNFSLHPGEVLQIVGCNGSGKSTLLRCLMNLSEPAEGKVEWQHARHAIYIGHHNAIKPSLSVRENIESLRIYAHHFNASRIASVLHSLHLPSEIPVRQLSAGQQRRLCLARLLLEEASVWILDEPYAALDAAGIEILDEWMRAQVDRKGAVILTSHQRVSWIGVRKIALGELA